ncbi:MAG: D-aminoacylase [bacterium]
MNSTPRIFLALFAILFAACQSSDRDQFDILITNGTIVDGTGNPWYRGDVGIRGDRIVSIGKLSAAQAKKTIDAAGKIVCPGFIDILGQSEYYILIDNRAMSKISQGITTEVNGEGESPAPVNERIVKEMKPFLDEYNLTVDWKDYEGYFKRVEQTKSTLNLGSLVGAAQVREYVIGFEDRAPTPQELEQMKQLVRDAMKQGAMGLSTALEYAPAMYAKTPELIELAKAAAEYGGTFFVHLRSEQEKIIEAVHEAADIGRAANIPVEIWHLKVAEQQNWGRMSEVVRLLQHQREQGLDITADQYPYTAFGNDVGSLLPSWAREGGTEKILERLKDPQTRVKMRKEIQARNRNKGPDFQSMMLSTINNPELKQFEGKRITELSALWKKDPIETVFDLLLADSARTSRVVFAMNEEDLKMGMGQPWISFCTDASARATDGPLSKGKPHPRAYGSFPRILGKYVREEKLLSLEEAVRKMTSLPAARFGIQERGLVKTGFFADVVIFDPNTVIDKATFIDPHQYSVGIEHVFVNGSIVWEQGKVTENRPGRVIRGPGFGK